MINLNSEFNRGLQRLIAKTISTEERYEGYCEDWIESLQENPYADGFLAILEYQDEVPLFNNGKDDVQFTFNDWILNVKEWSRNRTSPTAEGSKKLDILFHLWEQFERRIEKLLEKAYLNINLPAHGGMLVFMGGLSKCVILDYNFSGKTADIKPISVINEPKSLFDFWGAIDQLESQSARTALKNIISTGHKIVAHRGILTHVDRRDESSVFGPSIDTLILSEILSQLIYENSSADEEITRAIEIGSGSGFLVSSLIRHLPNLEEIFAIDLDFSAISCTAKNTKVVREIMTEKPTIHLLNGPFDSGLINRTFDLAVCNPPYIPIPRELEQNSSNTNLATSGLSLAKEVLESCGNFLSIGGELLFMTSNLAYQELVSYVPENCEVKYPLGESGFRVMFDIEEVINDEFWLEFLMEEKGLTKEDNVYYHELKPTIITRVS